MSQLHTRRPTARTPHRCLICGVTINPGARYYRETNVYEGRVGDFVCCLDCDAISATVWGWCDRFDTGDDGLTTDDYDEWAMDNLCSDSAAPRYLARRNTARGEAR